MKTRTDTKKLAVLAMLCAISYVVMWLAHMVPFFSFVPALPFLKYDPKDIVIAIGGFLYGPLEALAIATVVSVLEMATISTTDFIGLLMNILSTAAFVCPAALIYKKRHRLSGAVIGLSVGVVSVTAVMLLWNYLITPVYMKIPRQAVVDLLLPAFLPFNLIKSAINMALTLLIYKPITTALRRAHLLPESGRRQPQKRGVSAGLLLFAAALLATCLLVILVLQGVI